GSPRGRATERIGDRAAAGDRSGIGTEDSGGTLRLRGPGSVWPALKPRAASSMAFAGRLPHCGGGRLTEDGRSFGSANQAARPDPPASSRGWARRIVTERTPREDPTSSSLDRPELAIDDDPPPRHVVALGRQSPGRQAGRVPSDAARRPDR